MMNKKTLEKILNPVTFLLINLAIILLVELTGQLFFNIGAIHIIALFFVVLAVVRVFVHYYTYDPILEKFFHACLAALFVFAISHLVEYFSMHIFHYYSDSVFANTTNFYLISLMLIIIGAEAFLRIYDIRSAWQSRTLAVFIGLLIILVGFFMSRNYAVSLDIDNPTPYAYVLAVLFFGGVAIRKAMKIGQHVKFSKLFARYMSAGIVLIMLATLPYIFYELLEMNFGVPMYQIMYLSHFFFYASLSLMFLAFGKITTLGGELDDLNKMSEKKKL